MEEIPFNPNQAAPQTETAPDPEKIGDLLLRRFELPESAPARSAPVAIERDTKLLVSRDKLRSRLSRYKEQKLTRLKEVKPQPQPLEEVPEAHFERRHEIRDDSAPADTTELNSDHQVTLLTQPSAQTPASSDLPSPTPPPIIPDTTPSSPANPAGVPAFVLKKYLIIGLSGGIITGLVIIFLLLS